MLWLRPLRLWLLRLLLHLLLPRHQLLRHLLLRLVLLRHLLLWPPLRRLVLLGLSLDDGRRGDAISPAPGGIEIRAALPPLGTTL